MNSYCYTLSAYYIFVLVVYCMVVHWLCALAPAGPPVNVRVEDANSYSVLVQWLPPEVPNGIITHYSIYINYTNGTHHKKQVCGEISLYLLEELMPHQMVGIRVSASTIAGEGPLSVEKTTRTNETGLYNKHSTVAIVMKYCYLFSPTSSRSL